MYILQNLYVSSFVLLLACPFVWGKRPFDIFLETCEYSSSPVYVKDLICVIDHDLNKVNISARLERGITDFRYSFDVVLFKKNNERYTLFNVTNNDGCAFLEGKSRLTLLNMLKETLNKSGNTPPKCPVAKAFELRYRNLSIDVEQLPPYVPETKFRTQLTCSQNDNLIFNMQLFGEVRQKPKKWWG